MGQILVRNLDDEVIEAIRLKAELNGHSLEQELRDIIKTAAMTASDRSEALKKIRAMQAKPVTWLSEDLIREDRMKR